MKSISKISYFFLVTLVFSNLYAGRGHHCTHNNKQSLKARRLQHQIYKRTQENQNQRGEHLAKEMPQGFIPCQAFVISNKSVVMTLIVFLLMSNFASVKASVDNPLCYLEEGPLYDIDQPLHYLETTYIIEGNRLDVRQNSIRYHYPEGSLDCLNYCPGNGYGIHQATVNETKIFEDVTGHKILSKEMLYVNSDYTNLNSHENIYYLRRCKPLKNY